MIATRRPEILDTNALVFWIRRLRDFRRLYDSPVLDEHGRGTALAGERRAAMRLIDVVLEMPEEHVNRIGGAF